MTCEGKTMLRSFGLLQARFMATHPKHGSNAPKPRSMQPISVPADFTSEHKYGITIERDVPAKRLVELEVPSWAIRWSCKASKFSWKYEQNEILYLLHGRARVYPDGEPGCIEIAAGDIVYLPKGLLCAWHAMEDIEKTYKLYD